MSVGLVGSVVGPIADIPTGGSAAQSSGKGYDVAIGDLFFKLAITDTDPYQRATAQFRKDQLDAGQNPGDQSLTGWWSRGQMSFHKGAGITYYEVEEGEAILSRFTDGEGVAPFVPGNVTCQHAWTAYSAVVSSVSYVSAIDTTLVALDGTTLKYGNFNGVPTSYVPAGGATVRAATTSPTLMYAALSNGKISSVTTGGVETTLYTGLTTTIRGIWYVKSRLIISDSDGKWYQLAAKPAAPPQAVAGSDVIFTGSDWASASAVCDTPGPILIGNSNRIFAATLDSTGSIPTLTAPVQVGELPPGETIAALAHHLGFVILVTGAGVRVGVLSDNGQLTYGPLLVERATATTAPPTTSISRYSTKTSVVLDSRIIEIDLSEQIGNGLEFGWVGRGEPFASQTAAGVTTLGYSTQIAWANNGLWNSAPGSNYMPGWVQTGFHRFATLEPKRFESVRVRATGSGGTIGVTRVDQDGTETFLYNLDTSVVHDADVSLGLTQTAEAVGLKFSLTPSGDLASTPTLLGYQLRALPQPKRQRMIRLPLLLHDVESRQPVPRTGRKGSAWERLRDLEDLEVSGIPVTYRDFRTGEAASVYIESVEFSGKTPPTANQPSFGGTLYLTIRKLS